MVREGVTRRLATLQSQARENGVKPGWVGVVGSFDCRSPRASTQCCPL